ncbi:hypothetical protein KEM56_001558 [Ascosphaera pollenicola]|nr:hypothetical protein KEM56_001558 [Ascosphaera pollenicola]
MKYRRDGSPDMLEENPRKRRRMSTSTSPSETELEELRDSEPQELQLQQHEHAQGLLQNASSEGSSAEKTVAPFLARHIRDHHVRSAPLYESENTEGTNEKPDISANGSQRSDSKEEKSLHHDKSENSIQHKFRTDTVIPAPKPALNSRYCYRHNPDLKCRRQADGKTMDELQRELHTLPAADQQSMAHFWSLFSAAPFKHRNLMLQGILSQCCFPQLSYLAGVIDDLIRIDFLVTLPNEISFQILSYLDTASLCKAAQVSRAWRELADDDVVWHRMCEQHIDRKCKKCGWGLPLLERKRLRDSKKAMEARATGGQERQAHHDDRQRRLREQQLASEEIVSTTSSDVSLSPPPPGKTQCQLADEEFFKCRYRPWKHVYRDRFKVGINWKHGRYSTKIFRGHTNAVMCLQICDASNVVATGSYDATIKIWDLETGEELRTLRGHAAGIRCLQFDETKLISGSLDRTIKVWNWRTGGCVSTYSGHQGGVISLHFDSKILLSGSMDSTVRIWNFEDRSVRTLKGHNDWVNSVRVDTPSRTVFTASDDLTAKLWDLDTGCVIQTFEGHVGQVQQVLSLPREFEFEEHDAECNNINDNNTNNADDTRSIASHHSHGSHGDHAVAATSPAYAATFFQNHFDDDEFGETRLSRPEPPQYIVTAGLDSILRLWHVPTGRCLRTFFGHIEGVWAMGADTLRLVSGSEDSTAKVWDPRTGSCERTFTGHTGPVTCVGLTDEMFATGGEDSEVRVYDFRCAKGECP